MKNENLNNVNETTAPNIKEGDAIYYIHSFECQSPDCTDCPQKEGVHASAQKMIYRMVTGRPKLTDAFCFMIRSKPFKEKMAPYIGNAIFASLDEAKKTLEETLDKPKFKKGVAALDVMDV